MKAKFSFFVFLIFFIPLQIYTQNAFAQSPNNLPEDFPEISIVLSNNPSPGYHFFNPVGYPTIFPDAIPYLIIMDNFGTPVFYQRKEHRCNDFKRHPNGNLSYFASNYPNPKHYILNDKYQIIDSVRTINYWPDGHDLQILTNGHYFVMGYDARIVNMDTVVPGGQPNAQVEGLVIQELNTENEVVFQWSSWDHMLITDANDHIDLTASTIDWIHGNTIEVDSDTTVMISCRNLDEITKIDRRTGEIIWRLGGKNNQFEFINDERGFSYQHAIRRLDNGNITLYDNGVYHEDRYSSSLEYELDEINKTVTLIHRYRNDPDIYGGAMGNAQKLPNGNTLVGWGFGTPNITEFHENGEMALVIDYPAITYRAFKFNWETTVFETDIDTIQFESLSSSDSVSSIITLTNNLDNPIEITSYHHHSDLFFIANSFPFTIPPHDTYEVTVGFNPQNAGESHDILTINSDINSDTLVQRIARQVYLQVDYPSTHPELEISEIADYFPNPNKGMLTLRFKKEGPKSIYIWNSSGSLIFKTGQVNEDVFQIDLKKERTGIYFIQIKLQNEEIHYNFKMIKS